MNVEHIVDAIKAFLSGSKAEVLCIRGNWGTGKTYLWNDLLKQAKDDGSFKLESYSYVSLFGVNSIDQIKDEIFINRRKRKNIGEGFAEEDVRTTMETARALGKATGSLLALWNWMPKGLGEVSASLAYLTVRNQLICFDDIERKGEDLRSADVLGFVSQLKEARNCHIVILLNDEQLDDKREFEGYLEKVVDINLKFAPTSARSVEIALPAKQRDRTANLIYEKATSLGIDNVRVIWKIERLIRLLEKELAAYEAPVFESVVSTIALMGWSHYQPELAPPLEYIKNRNSLLDMVAGRDKEASPEQVAWNKILDEYGYGHSDELDLALMDGVKNGFFDKDIIAAHAEELNSRVQVDKAREELKDAWYLYHYSFTRTEKEVIEAINDCFLKNIQFYGASSLGAIVTLFRDLGAADRAEELINRYLKANKSRPEYLSLDTFSARDVPKDLREIIQKASADAKPNQTVDELFLSLNKTYLEAGTAEKLADTPEEEYYRVMTTLQGQELLGVMSALQSWMNTAAPRGRLIFAKTQYALQKLANESAINMRRAKSWKMLPAPAATETGAADGSDNG